MYRKTILITGSLGLLTLACLLVLWPRLVVAYHVWKVRREPEYFKVLLDSERGSRSRQALEEYVTWEGDVALMDQVITLPGIFSPDGQWHSLEQAKAGIFSLGEAVFAREGRSCVKWDHVSWDTIHDEGEYVEICSRTSVLMDLLPLVAGRRLALSKHPGLSVHVLPFEEARSDYKRIVGLDENRDATKRGEYAYACVVTPE